MRNLTYLFLFVSFVSFSQTIIKYENGTQDLKELIVIQTLLAENRIDDLSDFIINNNYVEIDKNTYCKMEFGNQREKGEIFPVFVIKDYLPKATDIQKFSNKGITVFFTNSIENWGSSKEANATNFEHIFRLSEDESVLIFNIITNIPKIGSPYGLIKIMKEWNDCELIDRYTLKDTFGGVEKVYKASNFTTMGLKQSYGISNMTFWGPGEVSNLALSFSRELSKNDESLYYIKLDIMAEKAGQPKDKMNVDFFMSLKNFNDRIWIDK
jgi:hypothetical protein